MTVADAAHTETCFYGDYRGLVYIDENTRLTCGDTGQQHPYKCYEETHSIECCKTCVDIRNDDKPGRYSASCRLRAWRSGRAFARDPKGRGFESRPVRFQVTALGKLLTRMCPCHQAV